MNHLALQELQDTLTAVQLQRDVLADEVGELTQERADLEYALGGQDTKVVELEDQLGDMRQVMDEIRMELDVPWDVPLHRVSEWIYDNVTLALRKDY